MKHDHIPDKELQAAVDKALNDTDTSSKSLVTKKHYPKTWKLESKARLHLARALLDALPDPTPPVVEGKTPGQVAFEAWSNSPPSCGSQWLDVCAKTSWEAAASAVLAARAGQEAEPKPETSTFEAHGKTWTRHTPGDPMPCDGERMVEVLFSDQSKSTASRAGKDWVWEDSGPTFDDNITCWRYADEPTSLVTKPDSSPTWTPAVGDLVQLKSGGPVMVVEYVKEDESDVVWINSVGDMRRPRVAIATLKPAKEEQP
jgi:uncharacterized protein YodC (DUF2158 family)